MKTPPRLALLTAAAFALAACTPSAPAPAEPVTPAPPPVATPAPAPAPTAAPDASAKNDPAVINFEGFGPAKFGADEEAVRQSWGRPLTAGKPAEGATCYQLRMDPAPDKGFGISFLFEDGGFARYDVDSPAHVAPGDIVVGAKADEVKAKFAGRVEEQPAKYVEGGKVLVVKPENDGDARLMFDVDATGVVTSWHIGRPPQVYYVEGCG
jgi:hypothetical protein